MIRKTAKTLAAVILAACFILPISPVPVLAGQNPSYEEIAKIFNKVAQEKHVPAEILEAIAFHESHWKQWYSNGKTVGGYYIGIMQVSTPKDPVIADRLRNDIAFNIAYGADMLISKWNATPRIGDGDPAKLENWYFAIWAYHRWDSYNNPHIAAANHRVTFQDEIYRLMNTEYIKGIVTPVKVTPIPPSKIPSGGVPSCSSTWDTPQPAHYAAFAMGMPTLSRSRENDMLSSVPRIYGSDRIDTALQIAAGNWPHGCETVIIAGADDFSDALAGAALAQKNNAPILLNPRDGLDMRVKDSLLNLKPLKVIILGGENAVSAAAEEEIRQTVSWTGDVERIAGSDRYETAALIAGRFSSGNGIAIANGEDLADAISLAAAAATQGLPLLLVGQDYLPAAAADVLQQLSPANVYIAGGEKVITQALLTQIEDTAGLSREKVQRIEGKDRYQTSANIVIIFFPRIKKCTR